jgi:hypothetical protein
MCYCLQIASALFSSTIKWENLTKGGLHVPDTSSNVAHLKGGPKNISI